MAGKKPEMVAIRQIDLNEYAKLMHAIRQLSDDELRQRYGAAGGYRKQDFAQVMEERGLLNGGKESK